MRKILSVALGLLVWHSAGLADHGELRAYSRQLSQVTYQLQVGARREIGVYPTPRQRYAYEHIMFFAQSAARFERVVYLEGVGDDHAHDQAIVRAFRKLEHDAYYARATFPDLFGLGDDHGHGPLGRLLDEAEYLVSAIERALPYVD